MACDFKRRFERGIAGNIMGRVAGKYIDEDQSVKALIVLQERKRWVSDWCVATVA